MPLGNVSIQSMKQASLMVTMDHSTYPETQLQQSLCQERENDEDSHVWRDQASKGMA